VSHTPATPEAATPEETDERKRRAAERAVERVASGMLVGLGTGTTAAHAVRALARRLKNGDLARVQAVATSRQTEALARSLLIPIVELAAEPTVDITIDGADEIDGKLNLLKGAGGALLREKIVAEASRLLLIVADVSKWVPALGTHARLPVEIIPFGWRRHVAFLASLGATVTLRSDHAGNPVLTDQGNYLCDCRFPSLADAVGLSQRLHAHAGIVEHGLFLAMPVEAYIADAESVHHYRI
jgi:ribose 5-phosphate isomerase A